MGYAFVAPNLLGLGVFTFLPVVFVLFVSLTRWNPLYGLRQFQWVGLHNYALVAHDPNFLQSLGLTAVYVGVTVPTTMVIGLAIAIALNGHVPGAPFLRMVFFLPFVTNLVASSIVWRILLSPNSGPINYLFRTAGIASPPAWLASTAWAMVAIILVTVWSSVGYSVIIYHAGLQNIPTSLYEAAAIDGVSGWVRFARITFPLLSPVSFLLLLTNLLFTSQTFGLVNLLTSGGPGRATTVLSYYVYQNAFVYYDFGYAAALASIMFCTVLILALALWRLQARFVHYAV